ncbi:MAG: hypothetical protein ABI207_03320 [Crocinitomicaceae bacterium]
MRKYLVVLGLLLSSFVSCAQKFTVEELIKLYQSDNDFFDTYVLQRGYRFSSNTKENIEYKYKDNSLFNSISITYHKDQIDTTNFDRNIFWIFDSDTTYLSFKKELSDLGFKMYYNTSTQDDFDSYHHFLYGNPDLNVKKKLTIELIVGKRAIYKVPIYYVNLSSNAD